MKILLHSPASTVRRNGNRQTSVEWARFLVEAGHEVIRTSDPTGMEADLFIALHANKSREAIDRFRKAAPGVRVLLALTGTDIYPEPNEEAIESMRIADGIITLQNKAVEKIPAELRDKVTTVIQSAVKIAGDKPAADGVFRIAVVGHLRDVKDPLLTAAAAKLLEEDSTIQVFQVGGILEEKYAALVAREEASNPRYHWLGELSEQEVARLLASSNLLVVSSKNEGGARVVGEAIVHGTPVLSTRIDGVVGLLGEEYPGFYPVGDASSLSNLMRRCETDPEFYASLEQYCQQKAGQFYPSQESASLLSAVEKAVA